MTETIQKLLALKGDSQRFAPVEYIETVDAYDKWAEVSTCWLKRYTDSKGV